MVLEAGRVAVVRTSEGWFLPGGGCEPGESLEQTLAREAAEECAIRIAHPRRLGQAIEHVYFVAERRYYAKVCTFFAATYAGALATAPEPDHALLWLAPEEALARFTHRSLAFAVRRVLGLDASPV